jgi:phosphoribosyl-AMP cyclohydrolase
VQPADPVTSPASPTRSGAVTRWQDVLARLSPDAQGLVAAIAQQWDTREVLMLAWMDAEALRRTLDTRRATYWSRSRQEYWVKGDTSGHVQQVREVRLDCDGDAVLLLVDQTGGACHTGDRTCFDADLVLADDATGGADA